MAGRTVSFVVPGDPVPQPRPRVCRRGHGIATFTPDNGILAYRQAVALCAIAAGARATTAAPLEFRVEFVFQRPPSHFHTSKARRGELKETARPLPRCDSSNCLKGLEDALNGIAYVDDSQIGRHIIERRYARRGEAPCTSVTITEETNDAQAVKP